MLADVFKRQKGFTIVELLIVIVVIAILAAVTVVAYNGIQNRVNISRSLSELTAINKAIMAYYADNGSYPNTNADYRSSINNPTDYVPSLVPTYISKLPISAHGISGNTGAYLYRSTATEYKLLAHSGKYTDYCSAVKSSQPKLIDPIRDCWAYGYWSSGGTGY